MPAEVLHEAAKAVREYNKTGISILELPHRGKEFLAIIEESKALVKELCAIGPDYEIMWMQGGGRMQFAMLPMNFLTPADTAAYADSGHWAAEAMEYARCYGNIHTTGTSREAGYNHLPAWPATLPHGTRYLHLTTNNTIYGTQYHEPPAYNIPLAADMSSDIFSRKTDYSRYAMFYAAAQKNLGTPGTALVVIHKDFLAGAAANLPPMLSYRAHAKENSVLNTANVSGIYISLLMLRWLKEKGIDNIERENNQKAALLYNTIDASAIYKPHVTNPGHRSLMNVCFTMPDTALQQRFMSQCAANNIMGIEGHRSVGGFRVSLYNAVALQSVRTLTELMEEFEKKHN